MLQYQARVIYMKQQNKYPIGNFYIGELYLYTQFSGMTKGTYIPTESEKIESFSKTGAINFQPDMISRYIDWENGREYTGFLTIFYKEGNNYICLHDGKTYQLGKTVIIDNLIKINDLLPKIDSKKISQISMYDALELFDILFNETEKQLYMGADINITDFYVGDLTLREINPIHTIDKRISYNELPQRLMLEKHLLGLYSYEKESYINTVYRCLFLKDGVDLYNIHNNQFYNPYEDSVESIIPLKEYMDQFEIRTPSKKTTITKALRLFERTIY